MKNINDCYPLKEWRDWIASMPEHPCNVRDKCRVAIIEDLEVINAAQPIVKQVENAKTPEEANAIIDNFREFVEDAAAILEEQPVGSHLRDGNEPPTFSTPGELRKDLTETAAQALKLKDLLARTATTIDEDALTLRELRRMLEQLDTMHVICIAKANKHTTKTHGVHDFPLGMAGKNTWRNWVLKRLTSLAEVRLGERNLPLTLAIHRVLLELDDRMNERTAAGEVGAATVFDPEYADLHANTFNKWAIENNHPAKSDF